MKKYLPKGALIALFILMTPFAHAYAATDHVSIERVIDLAPANPGHALVQAIFVDGSNGSITGEPLQVVATSNPITPLNSAFLTDLKNWAIDWANTNTGDTVTAGEVTWDGWGVMNSTQYGGLQAASSTPMSFATSTRSLNSAFQVSASRASAVSYAVDVATSLSLSGGQTGTVSLQYADDSGFTSNVKTVQSAVNGNTGTLTLGLNITQTGTAAVSGIIPAGKYVKLVTANTAGTPTFTYRAGQEVLLASN